MGAPELIVPGTAAGGPPVGGSGTANTIPRWTGTTPSTTLEDSALVQSGTNAIGFGTPKTWGTNFTLNAIQLSESASLSADINTTYLAANQYFDSPGFSNNRIKANFAARYLQNGATGDHSFQVAPFGAADSVISWTTAMTILNGGNVGIGTASPTDSGGWSAGRILDVRSPSAGTSAVLYVGDSGRATNTQLGFYGSGYGFVGTVTNHPFRVLQNNQLRGEWTTTSLDISSTFGYGLKLPATPGNTNPNTLDAYEDGGTAGSGGKTWTIADSSGAGLALAVASCQYIQIGKLVTICVDVTFPVTASGANASLTLPIGATVNWHAGTVSFQSVGGGGLAELTVMCNGAEIAFYAGTTSARQTNANLSNKRIIFAITYFTSQ